MSAPDAREAKCPNCGAAMGPAEPGTEYRCEFCGHVSATPGKAPEPKAIEDAPIGEGRVADELRLHLLWIGGFPEGVRADFTSRQLSRANLKKAALNRATFAKANLDYANLSGALLVETDLSGASLAHADLSGANLVEANLKGANLEYANLEGAILKDAKLSGANLRYAERVNLSGARFWSAKLAYATVVAGSPVRRLVAAVGWVGIVIAVALVAVGMYLFAGTSQGASFLAAFGPDWDEVGGPPIVASVAGGEVVVGRLHNAGKDDQLFVGAFDGASAKQKWRSPPLGTYAQGYRATHFTVSGPYVVVTDYRAKAHVYDLATGAELHTIALTDRIDGPQSVWAIVPNEAGLKQIDGRTTILHLATGAATEAPAAASSAPRPGDSAPGEVDLQSVPRIPGFARARAYRSGDTIVVYGHKSPGTPTPIVLGFDPGATTPRWQVSLPVVDPVTVRTDYLDTHTSAVYGNRFVGIYGAGQDSWHVTAIDTTAGARQWDVVLRPLFSGDPLEGLIVSASRVYIVREHSLEVHDAATGALVGTIGSENYR